jgi:uncharacterized protein YcbX
VPPSRGAGPAGLLHDRGWVVADSGGAALRLKHHPRLAAVQARVDLGAGVLLVSADGEPNTLELPLPAAGAEAGGGQPSPAQPSPASVAVCGGVACAARAAAASGGEAAAAAWFSRVLGLPCRLLQLPPDGGKGPRARAVSSSPAASATGTPERAPRRDGSGGADGGARQPSSFANEGQLLVLSSASLADLRRRCASGEQPSVFAQRFRWVALCRCLFSFSWKVKVIPCLDKEPSPSIPSSCHAKAARAPPCPPHASSSPAHAPTCPPPAPSVPLPQAQPGRWGGRGIRRGWLG